MLRIKKPMRLDEFEFSHYFWLKWPIMFRKHYNDVDSGAITTVTVNGNTGEIKIDGNITLEILEDFCDMQAAGILEKRSNNYD